MGRSTPRWLELVAHVALDRRRYVVVGLVVALLLSALVLPGLEVSTSRYGLVSEDNAYQRRLLSFFERFGYPDNPVVVVRGGTADERREVVDRLTAELETVDSVAGRVFGRIPPLCHRPASRRPPR